MIRLALTLLLMLPPGLAWAQAPITPGQINRGLAATFPPFEFVENGKPAGFDVAKGTPNPAPAIGTALKAVVADGGYAALLTKWNLPASSSVF